MRRTEDIDRVLKRLNKANPSDWALMDQVLYVKAIEDFCDAMEPLLDRNDPTKKWIMQIRRLDNL